MSGLHPNSGPKILTFLKAQGLGLWIIYRDANQYFLKRMALRNFLESRSQAEYRSWWKQQNFEELNTHIKKDGFQDGLCWNGNGMKNFSVPGGKLFLTHIEVFDDGSLSASNKYIKTWCRLSDRLSFIDLNDCDNERNDNVFSVKRALLSKGPWKAHQMRPIR